jgi:hypothetical protein
MSELQTSEFDKDVEEFRLAEKEIIINFTKDNIKLGEVLKRQRDKWKPLQKWTEYLNSIDRTLPYVNQRIRLYEYSINNMETVLKLNLTNWHKTNVALALSDDLKDKLAETINGKEVSNKEFIETIGEVKETESEDIEVLEEVNSSWHDAISSASFSDLPFMAKEILKQLNKTGYNFSNKCLPIIEGFLGLGKANKELKKENFKLLNKEEKKFWKEKILEQLKAINNLF